MSSLEVKVDILRLLRLGKNSASKVDEETLLEYIEQFAHHIRNLYLRLIEEAMNDRRYGGEWEPRNDPEYLEYLGTTPNFYLLDLLDEALEVKKVGYNYIIQFNRRMRYPGTHTPLVKVLRAIDAGTSKFNARPIFSKIRYRLRHRITDLWKGYLIRKGVI